MKHLTQELQTEIAEALYWAEISWMHGDADFTSNEIRYFTSFEALEAFAQLVSTLPRIRKSKQLYAFFDSMEKVNAFLGIDLQSLFDEGTWFSPEEDEKWAIYIDEWDGWPRDATAYDYDYIAHLEPWVKYFSQESNVKTKWKLGK